MKVNQQTTNNVAGTSSSEVAAARKAKQTGEASKAGKGKSAVEILGQGAKPEISDKAKEFSKVKQVAADTPDVREAKIAELRKRIEEGKYQVNAKAVADRMVDEHAETHDLG